MSNQSSSASLERKPCDLPVANADQEAWVQARIRTAMRMAVALHKERKVAADSDALNYAIEGVAEGAAREIIKILGMQPEYVNIRNRPHDEPSVAGLLAKVRASRS